MPLVKHEYFVTQDGGEHWNSVGVEDPRPVQFGRFATDPIIPKNSLVRTDPWLFSFFDRRIWRAGTSDPPLRDQPVGR